MLGENYERKRFYETAAGGGGAYARNERQSRQKHGSGEYASRAAVCKGAAAGKRRKNI